ncbi:N-acetylmuramic acid 6-phosphate etherase [Monashia sp. NPDC004114]
MDSEVRVEAPTEQRNPGTMSIDTYSSLDILRVLNAEDATVPRAVGEALPELAVLVDRAVESLRAGGAIHYFGAGTSGRLAVLDAAELVPTFNVPAGLVVAHLAGGTAALGRAVENVEDDTEQGRAEADGLREGDIAIGLTASGRTPFVAGALARAREIGAVTALLTANPDASIGPHVDHLLVAPTGPEVVTGSTRLKAGTAQKLVLGSFSTAVMIRLGRTWSNLMVDVVATNAKLRGRVVRILQEATGDDADRARRALDAAGGQLKPALLSMLADVDVPTARRTLDDHEGSVAGALAALRSAAATSSTWVSPVTARDPAHSVGRVVVAVDIGGSALRLQTYAGRPGPVLTAPGVRVGPAGIQVGPLVEDALRLLESVGGTKGSVGARPGVADDRPTGSPDIVVWSMRGLLMLADREAVLREVSSGLGAATTVVVSDAVASLVGAIGRIEPGAVVAAGTGAVAFGTDFDQRWNRVDGWGHLLGDRGSAAWVGTMGLRAAIRAVDGLPGGSPVLLQAASDLLGGPEGWPRLVMTADDTPARLASVAPLVSEAATEHGDPVAAGICRDAGIALADSLVAAAAGLERPHLVATGGLLASEPIRTALDARLAATGRARSAAVGAALNGAMVLGRHLLDAGRLPEHPAYLLVDHRSPRTGAGA